MKNLQKLHLNFENNKLEDLGGSILLKTILFMNQNETLQDLSVLLLKNGIST
jgi:hypothetical protein